MSLEVAVSGVDTHRTAKKISELPQDVIRVKGTKVIYYAEFTLWNLDPWRTLEIRLLEDGSYFCASSTPDGGGQTTGTLDHILATFHPDIAARYRNILTAENPDNATLLRLYGRRNRCLVEFEP